MQIGKVGKWKSWNYIGDEPGDHGGTHPWLRWLAQLIGVGVKLLPYFSFTIIKNKDISRSYPIISMEIYKTTIIVGRG